tara:strand:+ start:28670 stop:28900 length:231 start_codon:yes stop_codon:yes gene_type:complete
MTKPQALKSKLPGFILPECWQGFVDMRYSIKKPLTERSITLIIMKLKRLDESMANEILDQSTINCWQGIFPLRDDD